jgi:lipoprotein NlpD
MNEVKFGRRWMIDSVSTPNARNSMNSRLRILRIALSLALVAGCAPRVNRPPAAPARPSTSIYHFVRPGENLFRIGKAYDVPLEELARANGITDASQIRVGQRIIIPGVSRSLPVGIITPVEPQATTRGAPQPGEINGDLLLWPVNGMINSGYGPRGSSFHDGIDIAAAEGTPILAVEKGEVIYSDQLRGYGNIVIVRHGAGIISVYAHNEVNLVREGQQVAKGETIARVGSTGRVTGPHLHFEIRKNNSAQDPLRYLPQLCCVPASDNVPPKG